MKQIYFLFCIFFLVHINAISSENKVTSATSVINIGIGDNPSTLDPQRMEDQVAFRIAFDLYESLLIEDESGSIEPGIAEKYTVSNDGKIYTFYLKKNAKFSDGSAIQASDVVFSFRRLVDPKIASPSSYMAKSILNAQDIIDGKKSSTSLGIKAINPTTVQIELIHPVSFFPSIIATPNFSILKENINKGENSVTFKPGKLVSSGAYVLTGAVIGDKFTAQKNPYYWDAEHVGIQTVNYFPIHDSNAELRMFRAGQIDFTFAIPPSDIQKVHDMFPKEIKINPLLGIYYLTLNMKKEPFKSNLKLRKALSMAIDRDVLVNKILGRHELLQYDLVPEGTVNYTQQKYEWENLSEKNRLDEAKRLFKEAGFLEKPFRTTVLYNTDVLHKKVILSIISMWEKTFGKKNISITLENVERKVFFDDVQNGNFLIARDSWFADYNDASVFTELLISNNLQNFSGYTNPIYNKLQDDAALEQNIEKRKTLFEKSMKLAMNDYPVIPLFRYVSTHLVKPYVKGYTGSNILDHVYTKYLYLEK